MTLVVEDGTGKTDANGYISTAYADTYFADRGVTTWTGTDDVKGQAIIKATDYIETRWTGQFLGRLEFPDAPQALSFPRLGLYDKEGRVIEGMPVSLQKATAEYALRALSSSLFLEPTVETNGQRVQRSRDKVGPIEEEREYVQGAAVSTLRPFPAADRLIYQLVTSANRVVRA